MTQSRSVRSLAGLAAMVLLMSACGNGEPTETDASPTPTQQAETEGNQQEAETEGLVLGALLPETGDLAFLGEGMIAATEMAVADMNEAGGVLGQDVELINADEGDQAGTVREGADRLIGSGVDGIVGAASSGQSLEVLDTITGAGVLQCSGSNTSPTFTEEDEDLYFRTAPSDALQGPVLADLVAAQGHSEVGILARADDYGQGRAAAIRCRRPWPRESRRCSARRPDSARSRRCPRRGRRPR
ncbi:MAG: hypothetical protein BRC31_07635 [Actinobacteria bacterium QS_5_72_10]|nr:MAG: hypothetical protein BRC31_07635 [Actinobacteria bacterium QS_5_72_10]